VTTENARVYYGEGQRLKADDLNSEQAYLIASDARHFSGEHAAGIVRGLVGTGILGDRTIQPGIAIDGAGRQLTLSAPQPAPDPPSGQSLDLWLVYRSRPLRLRQPGSWDCGPMAFQRWREFGLVVTTAVTPSRAPTSPAEGALYLGRISSKSTADIRYAALLGGLVKDPGARSLMQIGPLPGHDRNGFVINADDSSGALTPRLLIDRRGNNVLYGLVTLLDYRACAVVPGPDKKSRILVEAKQPGPAGERIRVDFAFDSAGNYRLQFLSAQGGPRESPLTLSPGAANLQEILAHFTSALVKLTLLPQINSERSRSDTTIIGRGVALTPCGGMLELRAWPNAPGGTGSGKEPNGLSFLAIPSPQKGTPLPAIYSIKAADNGRPVEQLRLDLGAKKDADPTTRLATGATDKAVFVSWLTVTGKCGVTLIGGDTSDPNKPPISFNVTGTIEQAPIKPDPTDPEFTNLLVLAWLSGLERSVQATTVVQLAFENLPTLIETGQPWGYSVRATNQGTAPVTGDKLFETRSIAGQTLLTNIANQVIIPAGGNQAFPINHRANEMPAGELSIEVRMSGKIGNFPWWKSVSTPAPIPVVDSPQVDLSDVPDSVPPGATWDHSYTVKNISGIAIKLSAATITEGAGPPQVLPATQTLHQNEAASFGPVPHPSRTTAANLSVAISVDFSWEHGPVSNVTARKTIHVTADLAIDFQTRASLHVNTAWSYSLVLRNVGPAPLAMASLKQRLSSADFAATTFADIPLAAPINLNQGASTTVSVTGIPVPTPTASSLTHKVTLEIQPAYKRGSESRTWEPRTESKEIDYT
jgi:hypothetical protein